VKFFSLFSVFPGCSPLQLSAFRSVGRAVFTFALADLLFPCTALAQFENFDAVSPGQLPTGWIAGVTGSGRHQWRIETDASAPSQPNVLIQRATGDFPWIVSPLTIESGLVEVRFKPLQGKEDQAGGLVWRWKDGNNYYVARANALENNLALYYVVKGRRTTILYVDAPVAANVWHVLAVEFSGPRIAVSLDGRRLIDVQDTHLAGAGAVGLWTKADSVTAFDDFRVRSDDSRPN
jgi:hypothetical protein